MDMPGFVLVPLVIAAVWLIPLAAAIWALTMLHQIRSAQQIVQVKLDAIERLLQRS